MKIIFLLKRIYMVSPSSIPYMRALGLHVTSILANNNYALQKAHVVRTAWANSRHRRKGPTKAT